MSILGIRASDFGFGSKRKSRKKTLSYYKAQAKKINAKLLIKKAKKELEDAKSRL